MLVKLLNYVQILIENKIMWKLMTYSIDDILYK